MLVCSKRKRKTGSKAETMSRIDEIACLLQVGVVHTLYEKFASCKPTCREWTREIGASAYPPRIEDIVFCPNVVYDNRSPGDREPSA